MNSKNRPQSVRDATGIGPAPRGDNKPIVRRRPLPGGKVDPNLTGGKTDESRGVK